MLFMRLSFKLISYSCLFFYTESAIISDTWVSCAVNYTALSSSNAQKQLLYSPSWNYCLVLATRLRPTFSYLACYATGTCEVYGTDSYFLGDVVKNGTLGSTQCKVVDAEPPEGCLLQNGTIIPEGTSVPAGPCPSSANRLVCTDGEMVIVYTNSSDETTTTSAPAVGSVCESPFIQETFGCIRPPEYGEARSYCLAEDLCKSFGGTLISLDTAEAFNETSLYLNNMWFGAVWVGARLVAPGVWRWDTSDRDPGAPSPGDWATGQPNSNTQSPCAGILQESQFRLATKECSLSYPPFCEKKL